MDGLLSGDVGEAREGASDQTLPDWDLSSSSMEPLEASSCPAIPWPRPEV